MPGGCSLSGENSVTLNHALLACLFVAGMILSAVVVTLVVVLAGAIEGIVRGLVQAFVVGVVTLDASAGPSRSTPVPVIPETSWIKPSALWMGIWSLPADTGYRALICASQAKGISFVRRVIVGIRIEI